MNGESTDITVRARYKDLGVIRGFNGVMSKVRSIGRVFTMVAALAATAGGAIGISLGARVEQNLVTVGTVAGATAEQLAGVTAEARRIGATTAFTAAQASEGMINLARAGLSTQQIIAATADTMKLAGATASDMNTATSAVAATLGQFGMKAEQTQRVVDSFAYSTSRSLFNLPALAESMKYAGTTAKGLGMSLEDAVTAVSAFANLGLEGSMSGMAFRMAMTQLASGTDKVRDALQRVGLQYENVNPTTHDYATLIENLGKGHLDAASAVDIFGTRAGLNMLQVINQVKKGEISLRDFRAGILDAQKGTGLAAQQYERMMDTLAGDWAILKSTVQEMFLTMFDDYSSFLRKSVRSTRKFISDVTGVYQELVENWEVITTSMKDFVVRLFTDYSFAQAVGNLVAEIWVRMSLSIGDFVWALMNIATDAAALVWQPFEAHFEFMLDSIAYKWGDWLNKKIMGPLNIVRKIIPFETFQPDIVLDVPESPPVLDDYWEDSGEEMEKRFGMITARIKKLTESTKKNFKGFGAIADEVFGKMMPKLTAVKSGVQAINDKTPVKNIVAPKEQNTVSGLADGVQGLLDKAEKLTALQGLIGKGIFSSEDEVTILRERNSLMGELADKIKMIGGLESNTDNLDSIRQLAEAQGELGKKTEASFEQSFEAAKGFSAKMKTVMEEISKSFESGAETVKNATMLLVNGFTEAFGGFFQDLVADSKNATRTFAANIIQMVGQIAQMLGTMIFLAGLGFMSLGWISGGQAMAAGLGLMALGGLAQGYATSIRQKREDDIRADQERQAALREGVSSNTGQTTSKTEITLKIQDETGSLSSRDKRDASRIVKQGIKELIDQGALKGAVVTV